MRLTAALALLLMGGAASAYPTRPSGGSAAVTADSPLTGDGSSGSHLACATCVTLAGSQALTNKTLTAPVLGGSITGTYTLAGTPTITSPAISGPTLSGSAIGTYTLAGTPTLGADLAVGTSKLTTASTAGITAESTAATGNTAMLIKSSTGWTTGKLLDLQSNTTSKFNVTLTDAGAGVILNGPSTAHLTLDGGGTQAGSATTNIGISYNISNGIEFQMSSAIHYRFTTALMAPETDNDKTLGTISKRFSYGYVGGTGADITCDATTRGSYRTFFAAGGASDKFRVCLKAAADTYSWVDVGTAP